MPRNEYEKEKGEELSLGITGYDLAKILRDCLHYISEERTI